MTATSVTIGTAGGDDYSTFSAWQTGEAGDLTAAGQNIAEHLVSIGDDWASGNTTYGFQLSGWTTDSTHKIKWQPQAGEGHGGVSEAGFFFYVASGGSPFYQVHFEDVHIDVEEIEAESATGYLCWNLGFNTHIHRCIVRRTDNGGSYATVSIPNGSQSSGVCKITSCWIEANNAFAFTPRRSHGSATEVKQNLFLVRGTGDAFQVETNVAFSWDVTMENCMVHSDSLWGAEPNNQNNVSYCAFKSGIDDTMGTNTVTGVVETTGTDYVDFTNDDFTPVDGGKLDNAGTTVGPSEDLEGNSWVTNDIGPLIAAVAAGGGPSAGSLSLMGMGI